MELILPIVASFSGGAVVGGAYAAFITLIEVFPRLIQFTETKKYLIFYEAIFTIATFIFTLIYFFSDFSINIGKISTVFIGVFFGIFLGAFSSALAETLNVIPVITNKFKLCNYVKYVSISIGLGKVCGALYYFIIYLGG